MQLDKLFCWGGHPDDRANALAPDRNAQALTKLEGAARLIVIEADLLEECGRKRRLDRANVQPEETSSGYLLPQIIERRILLHAH